MVVKEFDNASYEYNKQLNQGLCLSGEDGDYFARKRIEFIKDFIISAPIQPEIVMDFGCGVGGNVGHLLREFSPQKLIASDISSKSLQILKKKYDSDIINIHNTTDFLESSICDFVFCNGVFHHIHPNERESSLKFIHSSLKQNGYFFFWENNPWNIGTNWVMSKIPFDKDALKIFPHTAVNLLSRCGFQIIGLRYFFIFPKFLKFLRIIEYRLSRLPMGAQYLIIAKKNEP